MSFVFCNSSRDNSQSRAKSFAPSRARATTENEMGRDKNHGLYSLASRLDIPFKGLYPDALRYELYLRVKPTRKVKCGIREKLACRCDYLTYSLFELKNKKNEKTAWVCYFCCKDLLNSEDRSEMHRYHYIRLYKHLKKSPFDDAYRYIDNKDKNMIHSAHYYGVINDDAKAVLLDDKCDSTRKSNLFKVVNLFWTIGNAYNTTADGDIIINPPTISEGDEQPAESSTPLHVDETEIAAQLYD